MLTTVAATEEEAGSFGVESVQN